MQIIQRTECLLTNTTDIEPLYTFGNFPIYMGCTDGLDSQQDSFADMQWGCSKTSGMVQLMQLIDADTLYENSHRPGTVGGIWKRHHQVLHQFINESKFHDILEIGGGSGELAKQFLKNDRDFVWNMIEPSIQTHVTDVRLNPIQGYFETLQFADQFDVVVHSHVFEHVQDPLNFLKKIHDVLRPDGEHFISIPNMNTWLANGYTNALMFEHTFFVDEIVLEYLLNKTGFQVVDKIIEDHSIFFKCVKTNVFKDVPATFEYIKPLFNSYIDRLKTDVNDILKNLQGEPCYLFGAHIFAQMLLNQGIDQSQVINILDNEPTKQGRRLYGTSLIVKSPQCLESLTAPVVIVRGGIYNDEIKTAILKINPTTVFY